MSGVWIASCGHTAQEFATVGRKLTLHRAMHEKPVAVLQRVSYSPETNREVVLDLLASIPGALPGAMKQANNGTIKLSPEIVAALRERTTSWSFSPRGPVKDPQTAIDQALNHVNHSDGFHETHKPPGSYEPVPYAERNYDWSYSSQHARAIPELEEHMAKLRERRQQVCKEAEAVRDWLHERETEYYKLKETASGIDTEKLQSEKHYLEVLGH